MSDSSAIVTSSALTAAGGDMACLRAARADCAGWPKSLFADVLALPGFRSESATDKVSGDVVTQGGISTALAQIIMNLGGSRDSAGSPRPPDDREPVSAELALELLSFGPKALVGGWDQTGQPGPASVFETQLQTPELPQTAAEKALDPSPTGRLASQETKTQADDAPSEMRVSEGRAREQVDQAAVTGPERSGEPGNKTGPSDARTPVVRGQVDAAASCDASKEVRHDTLAAVTPNAARHAVHADILVNLRKMGDPLADNPTASNHKLREKMADAGILGRFVAAAHVPGSRAGSQRSDGQYAGLSGREADARHGLGAGASQVAGKEAGSSFLRAGIHVAAELAAPGGANSISAAAQRAGAHVAAAVGSGSGSFKTPAQSVGEQILDSLRSSISRGDQQLSIRLRPPELGSVCVRFAEREEGIYAVFEVDRADTRREIERTLPDLLQSLQDLRVPVRRLEVTADESPQREPGSEQPLQDSRQQGSDGSGSEPQGAGGTGQPVRDGLPQAVADYSEAAAMPMNGPAGRIDMLM